jgi:hypothetical protein
MASPSASASPASFVARMTRARVLGAAVAVALASGASCGGAGVARGPGSALGRPDADWTLLVYIAADDDLERAAMRNVIDMASVGSTERANVIVQIDRGPRDRDGRGFTRGPLLNLREFTTAKRIRVERGRLVELEDVGETNTGAPEPLASFVAWGLRAFPARRTALVLWDHGGATQGFGWDVSNGDEPLGVKAARRAIEEGLARAGHGKLDVLGFDACLMGNLAVAYELRGVADVFFASEEVVPSHGLPYPPLLRAMAADAAPRALAAELVASFEARCLAAKTHDVCTMAAFDTAKLGRVADALDDLGGRILARMKRREDWFAFARARVASEEYGRGAGDASINVDAVDFAAQSAAILGEPDRVGPALEAAALGRMAGAARPRARGLSLSFPTSEKSRPAADATLELASRSRWEAFLRAYFSFAGADRAAPTVRGVTARALGDAVEVSAAIDGDDVADVKAIVGVVGADGGMQVRWIRSLDVAARSFRWDRTLPILSDGEAAVPVTVFEREAPAEASDAVVRTATIGGSLLHGGVAENTRHVVVELRLPRDAPPSLLGAYSLEDRGRAHALELLRGDRFAPLLRVFAPDGEHRWAEPAGSVALDDASRLRLEHRVAPAGVYSVGLRVTDYAANRHLETVRVPVP